MEEDKLKATVDAKPAPGRDFHKWVKDWDGNRRVCNVCRMSEDEAHARGVLYCCEGRR